MAEGYDHNWRFGSKCRGPRTQFRLGSIQSFKCTYPVHLTDLMDTGQVLQTGLPRGEVDGHVMETRTLTVRQYDERIQQLTQENLDLKMKIYLLDQEEDQRGVPSQGNTCEVIVNLQGEINLLRNELETKNYLQQEAIELAEKYQQDLQDLTLQLEHQQQQLELYAQLPSNEDLSQLNEALDQLQRNNDDLTYQISAKDEEINNIKHQLEKLSLENAALMEKSRKKTIAIQGLTQKYHQDVLGEFPKEIQKMAKEALNAAKDDNEDRMLVAIENFKSSLRKILPSSKKSKSTESSKENVNPKSYTPGSRYDKPPAEHMLEVMRENKVLQIKVEEQQKSIEDLSSNCEELSQTVEQLQTTASRQSILSEAEENIKSAHSPELMDSSAQTAIQWHLLHSNVTDKMMQNAGHSHNPDELKEDALVLMLIIEQKDVHISNLQENVAALQEQIKEMSNQNSSFFANADYLAEKHELQERLARSSATNNQLMRHLKNFEKFLEGLLQHKHTDSSSLDDISETSDFLLQLSKHIDETLKLSHVLEDNLSVCESSKLFGLEDESVLKEYSQLDSKSTQPTDKYHTSISQSVQTDSAGTNPFLLTNQTSAATGKRRLPFSSNTAITDQENCIVLGTSNNEDVILLLNEQGLPEDVMIRNNNDVWNKDLQEWVQNSKGSWYRHCVSSDSDIWSEPDRNVSMQRIGIDVQKSPIANQKSPRRTRHKRQTEDDFSKQESSSSFPKVSMCSKRRRSIDGEKERRFKELKEKNDVQELELKELNDELQGKQELIDALTTEKCDLHREVSELNAELLSLRGSEEMLASKGKQLMDANTNTDVLKDMVSQLEKKLSDSDALCETLKRELDETKRRLKAMDVTCSKSEERLSRSFKTESGLSEKLRHSEAEKGTLEKKLIELLAEKGKLNKQLGLKEASKQNLEAENEILAQKLSTCSEEMLTLSSSINNLELSKSQLLREKEEEMRALEKEIEELLVEKENLNKHLDMERKSKLRLEAENEILTQKLSTCSKEMLTLSSTIDTLELSKSQLLREKEEETHALEKEIGELLVEKDNLNKHLDMERKSKLRLEAENENLAQKLSTYSKENLKLTSSHDELKHSKSQLLREKDEEKRALEKEIEKLIVEKSKLNTHLDIERKSKQRLEAENESMAQKLSTSSMETLTLTSSMDKLKHSKSQLLREKGEEENALKKEIEKLFAEKENLDKQLEMERNSKRSLELRNESLVQKLSTCSTEALTLTSSIDELKHSKAQLGREKEEEKNALEKEIIDLLSEKDSLNKQLGMEKKGKQQLVTENETLSRKLSTTWRESKTLSSSNEELHHSKSRLLREKEATESTLISSNVVCDKQKIELEELHRTLNELHSKCSLYEKQLDDSSILRRNVVEKLSRARTDFSLCLNKLREMNDQTSSRENSFSDKKRESIVFNTDKELVVIADNFLAGNAHLREVIEALSHKFHVYLLNVEKDRESMEEHIQQIKMKDKEIIQLKQQDRDHQILIEELQRNLLNSHVERNITSKDAQTPEGKYPEIALLVRENEQLKTSIKDMQADIGNKEKQLALLCNNKIPSMFSQIESLQQENQKDNEMMKLKDDEIAKLQDKMFNLHSQVNSLMSEKVSPYLASNSFNLDRSRSASNASFPSNLSISSSISMENVSSEDQLKMQKNASDIAKTYTKKIKILKTKLAMSETRVEILEKEKSDLRKDFLAQVEMNRKSYQSHEDIGALKLELDNKVAFIQDLKTQLFQNCNSLMDKQNQVDILNKELEDLKAKYVLLQGASPHFDGAGHSNSYLHQGTKSKVTELRKQKWDLLQSLLQLIQQFHRQKNIRLEQFEKFRKYVSDFNSRRNSFRVWSSESHLETDSLSSGFDTDCDNTVQILHSELELDVECLQNLCVFLKLYSALLSCDSPPLSKDSKREDGSSSVPLITQSKDSRRRVKSCSGEQADFRQAISIGRSFGSHENLRHEYSRTERLVENFANISYKLDCSERDLKNVVSELQQIISPYSLEEGTLRNVFGSSLLDQFYEKISLLHEKTSEISSINSSLKSLGLFNVEGSKRPNKHDTSDRESVLSEETITLSRSLSPISFEESHPSKDISFTKDQFPSKEVSQKAEVYTPKTGIARGSLESIFQRSHYSSPDLGIESDPNRESSAPEQAEKELVLGSRVGKRQESAAKGKLKKTDMDLQVTSANTSSGFTVHAIGGLDEYELLKKEVQESVVAIKSILARTGEGLKHIAKHTSPRKNLEYDTLKSIKDTCVHLEVCLTKAYKLVGSFWIAPCPSKEELCELLLQYQKQQEDLRNMYDAKKRQEMEFHEAMERLKHAEMVNEDMDRKISKKLVKTKKVIKKMGNLVLERESLSFPIVPKYPHEQS